jgi:hypothetical protein
VEPVDQSGQRWVQAQIASAEWTRSVHFGQGDTPSGMRYRIYVLSTSTVLPVGELTKQPENPQESPAITVTLKKKLHRRADVGRPAQIVRSRSSNVIS